MQFLGLLRFLGQQDPAFPDAPNLGRQLGKASVNCIEPVLLSSRHAKA
jgi:hypothetical protein